MNTSSPRNTTKDSAIEHLLVAASPGGIEAQEAAGQREVLNSTTLPVEGSDDPRLLALGFTFGDKVPGDDLFRQATLPEGWARVGSDHSMHSYISDERGIERVNVFYKAAFYDRRADLQIVNVGRRLATEWIYGDGEPTIPEALTADELADAKQSAESYVSEAADPTTGYIRAERLPRAEALVAAIEARS